MSDDGREELGVSANELAKWRAAEPAAGFGERVMTALESSAMEPVPVVEPVASKASGTGAGFTALAVAAAALLGVAVWKLGPAHETTGAVSAEARTTVKIAERALAVVEPQTHLQWSVRANEDARVVQKSGSAFYRVERGGPFVVETPAGNVSVLGTCFRVEVTDMKSIRGKQMAAGAAIGAALGAAVVVTVYEGKVALANAKGSTHISAGQMAVASAGSAPTRATDATIASAPALENALNGDLLEKASKADVIAKYLSLQRTAAEQRAQLASRQAQLDALRAKASPGEDFRSNDRSFYPPDKSDLNALVEKCGVRADRPPSAGSEEIPPIDKLEKAFQFRPGEAAIVHNSLERMQQRYVARMRELYIEATGEPEAARFLSAGAMLDDMETKDDHRGDYRGRIARERAGLAEPPAVSTMSPTEQAFRMTADSGDELQKLLAQALGAERAHELRAENHGWPWGKSTWSGCSDKK